MCNVKADNEERLWYRLVCGCMGSLFSGGQRLFDFLIAIHNQYPRRKVFLFLWAFLVDHAAITGTCGRSYVELAYTYLPKVKRRKEPP
jgi:hypothetical protein